jgi:salicylate hydroxylase
MSTNDRDADVIVVGGGIGGLANAYALASMGQRVRVLERSEKFAEVGAGLQMAPNATRILREWGLLDEVIAAGAVPRRLVFRDAIDGKELTHLDLGDRFQSRYGAPYVVLHRSDLLDILRRACERAGVELVTGAQVDDATVSADSVMVTTGETAHHGDVLLAADGLRSGLRSRLSKDEPIASGYVAYRGAVSIDQLEDRDGLALDDVVVYLGPGCHLVQYPLRGGAMFNQVAVFQSPAYLRGDAEFGTPEELDAAFAGCCARVQRGLAYLWRDRRWPMYDRLPIENWIDGRLALTGDAAHPMLQYLAQGACQAIEDAHVLAEHTAKTTAAGELNWDLALAAFEQDRSVRTGRVQSTARIWGELWHVDGFARLLRNALLADRDPDDYRHIDWLYSQ